MKEKMYKDIDEIGKKLKTNPKLYDEFNLLGKCYNTMYALEDVVTAEQIKQKFKTKFGYWEWY